MENNIIRKSSTGLDENVAGLLCYLAGWITGVIFFILEKESRFVRFHALQSILVFLPLHIVIWILGRTFLGGFLSLVLWLMSAVLCIILMYRAYRGEMFKLPVAGDIAEKNSYFS